MCFVVCIVNRHVYMFLCQGRGSLIRWTSCNLRYFFLHHLSIHHSLHLSICLSVKKFTDVTAYDLNLGRLILQVKTRQWPQGDRTRLLGLMERMKSLSMDATPKLQEDGKKRWKKLQYWPFFSFVCFFLLVIYFLSLFLLLLLPKNGTKNSLANLFQQNRFKCSRV